MAGRDTDRPSVAGGPAGHVPVLLDEAMRLLAPAAGGIFIDYLARGRFHLVLRNPDVLSPADLSALTEHAAPVENPAIAGKQATGAAVLNSTPVEVPQTANLGLEEIRISNE